MLQDKEPKTTETNSHEENLNDILDYATNQALINAMDEIPAAVIDPKLAAEIAHIVRIPPKT